MVKRYFKPSVIKTYYPDKKLEGHVFGFGRVGAGKSVSLKSVVESFLENFGYKIFDIYGGEREEGVYWALPSQDTEYFERELGAIGTLDEEGPKQFKVDILYPYFESKIPKKLPKFEPNVNSKVFTIPLQDVSVEDIKMVLGNLSVTSINAWTEILYYCSKDDNSASLPYLSKKVRAQSALNLGFITPMFREKFLADKNCDYNLDLIKEARARDVVTVLCLEFVPRKFHLFVINYFIRKLTEHLDSNEIKNKDNIAFIREAAEFFRATEDSVLEDRFKIFRTNLSHYIRMGRRGLHFALDCQSAWEVKSLVQGSEDYLLMFKTTSWRDKNELCDELKREQRMRPDQVANLALLEVGECYIAETGKVVKKIKISLPRSSYWRKEYGNFHKNVWDRHVGEWKNINTVRTYINNKLKAVDKHYKEKIKEEKKDITKDEKSTVKSKGVPQKSSSNSLDESSKTM